MAREFKSDEIPKVYSDKEIQNVLEALKNLLYQQTKPDDTPDKNNPNGSMWLDRNKKELKYLSDGDWELVFKDKFSLIDKMLGPKPINPVTGQFWINKEYSILMYYDGTAWKDVRSVQTASDYNVSYYKDFLILGPLKPNGDNVIKGQITKSQFLLPSIKIDKIFLNGTLDKKYEQISPVSIQYPVSYLNSKDLISAHVNPQRLTNIKKKMILTDKIIAVPESDTEYYGFKNGLGTFLTRDVDYKGYGSYIELKDSTINKYTSILATTYVFGSAKTEGKVITNSISFTGEEKTLYIGKIPENKTIALFVQGILLNEENGDYSYNKDSGYIKFYCSKADRNINIDAAVILFDKKQEGVISKNKDTYEIPLITDFKKPILFIGGLGLSEANGDYVYDKHSSKIIIKPNKEDESIYKDRDFCVFEGDNMYLSEGITLDDTIKYDSSLLKENEKPIVFTKGLYISDAEAKNNLIVIKGIKPDMDYILLKNKISIDDNGDEISSNVIFHGLVRDIAVPTYQANDSMVYLKGYLLNDISSVLKPYQPKTPFENQIIKYVNPNTKEVKWQRYKNDFWEDIKEQNIIDDLEKTLLGYTQDDDEVNIVPIFENDKEQIAQMDIYSYKFANSIEKPLLYGSFQMRDDTNTVYNLNYNHYYTPRTGSVSVWTDGIRQHNIIEKNNNEVAFKSNPSPKSILLEINKDNSKYIIERPESGESASCESCFAKRISGTKNIYRTEMPLSPGNLRIFIGGLRQPSSIITMLDDFTFLLNDEILVEENNEITKNYIEKDKDGNIINCRQLKLNTEDIIYIEKRYDYNLYELTTDAEIVSLKDNYYGVTIKNNNLPDSLFESKDLALCYIDGLFCGPATINQIDKSIYIQTNLSFLHDNGASDALAKLANNFFDKMSDFKQIASEVDTNNKNNDDLKNKIKENYNWFLNKLLYFLYKFDKNNNSIKDLKKCYDYIADENYSAIKEQVASFVNSYYKKKEKIKITLEWR